MRARALLVVAALLAPVLISSAALAQEATLEIAVSDALVSYGQVVTVSGSVGGDPACAAGRTVSLQWRAVDSAAFAVVAEASAAADGTFAFEQSQPHSGRFRASATEEGACAAAVSAEVLVRVRVAVDVSVAAGPTEAGDCVDVVVVVAPPKPGQAVELQQRAGPWVTRERLTLDAAGQARAAPCFGWDDVGILRLRARWPAQDDLNAAAASPPVGVEITAAEWTRRIDRIVGGRPVSVSIGEDDLFLYRRDDQAQRIPASNEKLLLAMAMLDTFGPDERIRTLVAAGTVDGGVVRGDLWILGRGDPTVGRASMGALARRIAQAGIVRVTGSVMGSTTYFRRDWDAPGWNSVARRYVNRPTALTFEGNHAAAPERAAAEALTDRLEKEGVRVADDPGAGPAPGGLATLAEVRSRPLLRLLTDVLRPSDNFGAEVLGKGLGTRVLGAPGTIAKGAEAIEGWAGDHAAEFTLHDASGLSYDNRVTAGGLVQLLWVAESSSWGEDLLAALPSGGQGTLEGRLADVRIRAKTGTLTGVSTLSGWVWAEPAGAWIEFSILSSGLAKSTALAIEDRIVRLLEARVR